MFPDDVLLVKRVLAGEQSAFGPLIDRYWPRAMQLALRRLGGVADAEDVVQDAFLQALLGLRTLRAHDRFAPWLLGIVANLCRMYWRGRHNGNALIEDERWITFPFVEDGTYPSPESLYEARESYRTVLALLATLPADQQQAVRLHYLHGLTLGEISERAGTSPGAIKVRLHRARARLRLALLGEFATAKDSLPLLKKELYMVNATTESVDTNGGANVLRLPVIPARDIVVFPSMTVPLYIGRRKSIKAVEQAVAGNRLVFLATQRDGKISDPTADDLYPIGTVSRVEQILHLPDYTMKLVIAGTQRGRILRYLEQEDLLVVEVEELPEHCDLEGEAATLAREVEAAFKTYARFNKVTLPEPFLVVTESVANQLCNVIIPQLKIELQDKQDLLETLDASEQLKKLLRFLPSGFQRQLEGEPYTSRMQRAPTTSEVTLIAMAYFDGWKTRDIDRILSAVSEDCIFDERPMTMAEVVRGKQQLSEYLANFFTAFPELTLTVTNLVATEGQAWVEWCAEGVNLGEFLNAAPTCRRVTFRGASVYEVREGKVVHERRYWDAQNLVQQLRYDP